MTTDEWSRLIARQMAKDALSLIAMMAFIGFAVIVGMVMT